MKKNLSKSSAFTLVELMVVVAIISILTAIIITNLTSAKAKSRDAQRVSDLTQIQVALGLFFDRCNQFPKTLTLTENNGGNCPGGITLGSYIGKIPTPPNGNPASYDYAVNNTTTPTDYVLHTYLEGLNSSATANGLSPYPTSGFTLVSWSLVSPAPPVATCDTIQNYCLGPK